MSPWWIILAAVMLGMLLAAEPQPRMEIHWHQNCLYDEDGEPVNLCDRKYWDC